MALEKFCLDSLRKIDGGRLRLAVDKALDKLQADCADRPGLKQARKLQLTLALTPVLVGGGERAQLDSVDVEFEIKTTAPVQRTRTYNMKPNKDGLVFNEMSPEDADQMTFDDMDPNKE